MREMEYYISLDDFERRVVVNCLNGMRNNLISNGKYTDVVDNFVLNFDSYTGSMIHNYYLYEKDGQMQMIPWDYNLAFGGFQSMGDATSLVNYPIDSPVSGGKVSLVLSSMIFAVMFNMTFAYGWLYFGVYSVLELITFVFSVIILWRAAIKETVLMIALGTAIALILKAVMTFHLG